MNTLTRSVVVATILAAGGAMLAAAQGVPAPGTTLAEPAVATAENEAQVTPAQFREGRDGHRGGKGRGGRGALLGVFGPDGGRALFAELDADADGAVTQAEIDAFLTAQIEGADADADGALTLTEFEPIFVERIRPRMVDAFQALDADGTGTITAEEIDARFGDAVARLDRNDDGALTLQDGRGGRDRD